MNPAGEHQSSILGYVIGYFIGTGVFMMLIPYVIWRLSSVDNQIFRAKIIPVNDANIILSTPLFMVGAIFVIWSNFFLVSKGKGGPVDIGGVAISPRTKKLVTEGPYKYTRNPMVFGMNSIYMSIAIYLNSLGCLLVVALFFFLIVRSVVASEEKRLLSDFGDEYMEYKRKTPMIIPLPIRKTTRD
jgi:protein-S-isoprenylcysteine O-methyltransferase Ste14